MDQIQIMFLGCTTSGELWRWIDALLQMRASVEIASIGPLDAESATGQVLISTGEAEAVLRALSDDDPFVGHCLVTPLYIPSGGA